MCVTDDCSSLRIMSRFSCLVNHDVEQSMIKEIYTDMFLEMFLEREREREGERERYSECS